MKFKMLISENLFGPKIKKVKDFEEIGRLFFFLHADSALSAMPMTPMSPAPQCH